MSRRRLLRAAALAPAVPLAAVLATVPPLAHPSSTPGLHPTDPLPTAWEGWRNNLTGQTIGDLIEVMRIEASTYTHWNALDAARIDAHNAYLRRWGNESRAEIRAIHHAAEGMLIAVEDEAFTLGYALAMTRDQAPHGPEVWYRAALSYAGIVEMPAAEEQTIDAWRATIVDENWKLHGFERIDPAETETGRPVNSALDLARLAGYVPRKANEEASS